MPLDPRVSAKVTALTQRLIPSTRTWKRTGKFVTFSSEGFVAASGPEELLARHNYETREIHQRLGHYSRSLEIGCGYGRLSPHIADHSDHHVAVDINDDAIATARRHYPAIEFSHASMTDLPFPDSHFDLVVTWTVAQHLPPDLIGLALGEIARVATADSTLLMCEESAQTNATEDDQWHTHTWHRTPDFYAEHLPGFCLVASSPIEDLEHVGIGTPGTVIVLERA